MIQPDGKIVVAGLAGNGTDDFGLVRYLSTGAIDTSFGTAGKVSTNFGGNETAYGVALQSNGKIVAVGSDGNDFVMARYSTAGALDTSFGAAGLTTTDISGAGSDYAYAVVVEPSDKILVAGTSNFVDYAVARYTVNGALDTSFGTGGFTIYNPSGPAEQANAMVQNPDGSIVLGGMCHPPVPDFAIMKFK